VDDIVQAAGVSHGTFYRYFSNKDELFHELAQLAAVSMVDLIDGFPSEDDPDAMHSWLEVWFRTYRDNGGVISAWQEIQYEDPVLVAFSLDVALVTFDRLTRIVHRRGFGDATVDAIALLAVIERIPYNVLVLRHLDEAEAIDASAFIVRRGLFGLDV
jgi:AcrR family transcriptional regulator